jgi:hypothetical protein
MPLTKPAPPNDAARQLVDRKAPETDEEGRQRRLVALRKVAGIWKNRKDIPTDGLEYQRYMRNE